MPLKRCIPCCGSGKVMGGGMVFNDCDACCGRGKVEVVEDEMDYLLAKNTEGYEKAKQNIMALDKDITSEKAEELLDNELNLQKQDDSLFKGDLIDDKGKVIESDIRPTIVISPLDVKVEDAKPMDKRTKAYKESVKKQRSA